MSKIDQISQDQRAIEARHRWQQWQGRFPNQSTEEVFWKSMLVLKEDYSIGLIARFFGVSYDVIYNRVKKFERLQGNQPEFMEFKKTSKGPTLDPIQVITVEDRASHSNAHTIVIEWIDETNRKLKLYYSKGQQELLREILGVL